jgi:hypothetical protein
VAGAPELIRTAVTRLQSELPALAQLKLTVGVELRGRGDVQMYKVVLPGPQVTKDISGDAPVHVALPRARFNELATKGTVSDWRAALEHGEVQVSGPEQILKLISNVVERQEARARTRRARH